MRCKPNPLSYREMTRFTSWDEFCYEVINIMKWTNSGCGGISCIFCKKPWWVSYEITNIMIHKSEFMCFGLAALDVTLNSVQYLLGKRHVRWAHTFYTKVEDIIDSVSFSRLNWTGLGFKSCCKMDTNPKHRNSLLWLNVCSTFSISQQVYCWD